MWHTTPQVLRSLSGNPEANFFWHPTVAVACSCSVYPESGFCVPSPSTSMSVDVI